MEWLRRDYLYPEYQEELFTRGLKIYTTLDLDMQDAAEDAVGSILPNKQDPQAALVSMTPRGEVRALVGGRDFTNVKKARGFDFATDFPGRQAGSSFKPFTLLSAIEENISPSSTFPGTSPKIIPNPECADPDGTLWDVENYGGASYGSMTLDAATTNSVNTIYAQLVAEIGPDKVAELLDRFQFDREDTQAEREIAAVCSLALGTLDVTPLEMARSYAGFAGRGALPQVMPIRYITNSAGECLKAYRSDREAEDCAEEGRVPTEQVVEENWADVLNQSLTRVVSGGTATAANIGRPVAGKTGTTQNSANAWFAGHIPQLATVVWMGYPIEKSKDDPQGTIPLMESCSDPEFCRPVVGDLGYPINVTGGSFPARIWAAYMSVAVADMEILSFPFPSDLPDEVINARPSATPTPKPSRTAVRPTPLPSEPEPTPTQQTPEPSEPPNPLPTKTGAPDEDDG
jgi:penicillin-binding protein 1A